MTRQNVPLDPKSRISVTLEMTIPKSSKILTMAAQKPPPAPSGCITISRKKLVSNIDTNGEARINSWLDSMKASSPTHIKATPLADRDPSSFMVSIRLSLCSRKEGFFFGFWFLWCWGLHQFTRMHESDFCFVVLILDKNRFVILQPRISLSKLLKLQWERR